jgi:predicted GNAT family acetyltransferase
VSNDGPADPAADPAADGPPVAEELLVVRRDDLQEFHLLAGDEVVSVLGFGQRGTTVVLSHTATPEPLRHRGYASALVERALAQLDADGSRVVVRCPFVRWWQGAAAAGR